MKVKCPQCQKTFDIPGSYVGKEIKCLKCNHPFIASSLVGEPKSRVMIRLFPLILIGAILFLFAGVFLYRFQFGQFLGGSPKNVIVPDSNNVHLFKNTDSVNSLDKKPVEEEIEVEKKAEKLEKVAKVLTEDTKAIVAEPNTEKHKETIPILDPVIDNNSYSTDEFKMLPTLFSILDDKKVNFDIELTWRLWTTSLELATLEIENKEKPTEDPSKFLMEKSNIAEVIYKIDASGNPLMFSYKNEIGNLIQNSDFVFLRPRIVVEAQMPIKFASIESKPIIVISAICSDIIFNNVNILLNTPKKRASAFIQKKVLPALLEKDIFCFIRNTPFEYIGLVYIYGNKNFVSDQTLSYPESLCLVIPLKDYSSFIKRELSQEEFLKKCFVFLKSEGDNFVKVELTLD